MTQETGSREKMVCYRHPDRETLLRCNRCEQPICTSCALLTPTGYRCPECIRSQQKAFVTTKPFDNVAAALLSAAISFGGSWIAGLLGFFTLLITPLIGFLISEAVRRAVRKRRSKTLTRVATTAAALGSLPLLLYSLAIILLGGRVNLLGLIWQAAYAILVTTTVYNRLGGTGRRTR